MKRAVLFTLAFGLLVFFFGFYQADCRASDEWSPVTVCRGGRCVQILIAQNGEFQHGTQYVQAAPKQAPVAKPMPTGPHPVQACKPPLFVRRTPVRSLLGGAFTLACHAKAVVTHAVQSVVHRQPVRTLARGVVRVAFFRRCR